MLFIKNKTHLDGTPKTKKEILEDYAYKVDNFMNEHPYAFVAITCGTAHVLGHTLLHYATKPPKKTATVAESTDND